MRIGKLKVAGLLIIMGLCCNGAKNEQGGESKMETIQVTSPAFTQGALVPEKHTCDGPDLSPAINWAGAPQGTKSFALICDDPDAPNGMWVHWVIYNIPADKTGLQEDAPKDKELADGTRQGLNDWKRTGYMGPCPPAGTHRYFFKVYALDAQLKIGAGATKKQLLDAMEGHVLGKGELMGKYSRKR